MQPRPCERTAGSCWALCGAAPHAAMLLRTGIALQSSAPMQTARVAVRGGALLEIGALRGNAFGSEKDRGGGVGARGDAAAVRSACGSCELGRGCP